MSTSGDKNYLDVAKRFNLDVNQVKNGGSIDTMVQIPTLADFKEIFGGDLSQAHRDATHENYTKSYPEAFANDDENFLMTRLGAHVYGNHELSDQDQKKAEAMFPVSARLLVKSDEPITEPVVYGPSAAPVILSYGTLNINGKGSITTENTVLKLTADNAVIEAGKEAQPYTIGIMGVKGDTGAAGAKGISVSGQAEAGRDKSPASPGICTGVGSGGDGAKGADGGGGKAGSTGYDGKPSLQATISISKSLSGTLVVTTQSGAGGDGGQGGDGGDGQQGGNGGKGCDSGCEGTDGGDGGAGGNGGNGGNGGDGGRGVNGNDVYITVPSGSTGNVVKSSENAPPGFSGSGGAGGNAGAGGSKGSGGKHSSDGNPGASGNPGNPGDPGTDSKVIGSPGNIYVS